MEKYIQLVQEFYTEPKDGEILGSYLQVEAAAEGVNVTRAVPRNPPVQKKKKKSCATNKGHSKVF